MSEEYAERIRKAAQDLDDLAMHTEMRVEGVLTIEAWRIGFAEHATRYGLPNPITIHLIKEAIAQHGEDPVVRMLLTDALQDALRGTVEVHARATALAENAQAQAQAMAGLLREISRRILAGELDQFRPAVHAPPPAGDPDLLR